jgi:pyridinium-3,5-biscarboxylic acid mononucleotide sulfurtransferase
METAYETLIARLKDMDAALVAFSGGVDSTLLLAAARDALGNKVLAVTATSPTFSAYDFEWARRAALQLGVRWVTVETNELDDHRFRANPPNRCYFCKKRLFSMLLEKAREEDLPLVIEATNVDDLSDFRPGLVALRELGILSPFVELGIGKKDIRRLAKERGLENWDRPSSACLASRIPYGEEITLERLERIARAEASLRELGFRQVRVRDHSSLARIELANDDLDRLLGSPLHYTVVKACKEAGYTYVTLDLQGYRTGSTNETLGE